MRRLDDMKRNNEKHRKDDKMKKKQKPVLIVCLLIILLMAVCGGSFLIHRYMPVKDRMDLSEYYGQTEGSQAHIIIGTTQMEALGEIIDGQAYLPLETVNKYLNQRFYWDSENGQILYATPSELTSTASSSESGSDVLVMNDTVYLKLDYVCRYTNLETYTYQEPNRIVIQKKFKGIQAVDTVKEAYIRYRGGIKSEVLTQVSSGTSLIFLEELENWVKVATFDGYTGYVEKKKVSEVYKLDRETDFQAEKYQYISMDEPVNMAWHQVTTAEANEYLSEAIQNVTGVNVISPTWFSIADNSGNITNISSGEYVAQAHAAGMQVWGLIDNFSEEISTVEVLSKTSSRQNLIQQLMHAALAVGMDGINIDFEYLSEEVGKHFLEFLRELSIECHKNNLVLSVDNPVPEDFTSHYDRAEQGRVVDYVIIMGYDEHYVGSEEAGSVASLPWVEQGIIDTLEEVPASRVINAIPFYTRLWKTQGGSLSSEAIGMDQAQDVISKYEVETYWDKNAGQNYGSYETEEGYFQIWIEDAQSVAAKVKLVPKYGLAGVAQWKLGFENSSIWSVISENLTE